MQSVLWLRAEFNYRACPDWSHSRRPCALPRGQAIAAGGRTEGRGVQIDLLIQTRRSVHVVEVRHRREIGEEVEADVRAKCAKLKLPDNVAMRTGLVYDGQLDPVVRGNAFFDVILSSREILGLQ